MLRSGDPPILGGQTKVLIGSIRSILGPVDDDLVGFALVPKIVITDDNCLLTVTGNRTNPSNAPSCDAWPFRALQSVVKELLVILFVSPITCWWFSRAAPISNIQTLQCMEYLPRLVCFDVSI